MVCKHGNIGKILQKSVENIEINDYYLLMQNSFCDEISKRPSIWVERTTITKSATAAAGSGDLHAYRRFKRAETLRQREEEEIF